MYVCYEAPSYISLPKLGAGQTFSTTLGTNLMCFLCPWAKQEPLRESMFRFVFWKDLEGIFGRYNLRPMSPPDRSLPPNITVFVSSSHLETKRRSVFGSAMVLAWVGLGWVGPGKFRKSYSYMPYICNLR